MAEEKQELRPETLAVHAGHNPKDFPHGARAVPIVQSTSYVFQDADHAADLFGLRKMGPIYTRIGGVTAGVLEARVAALEGGVAALTTPSGQSATTMALLALARSGQNVVSSPQLYGGTGTLFNVTLPRMGIDVRFAGADLDPKSFDKLVDENTRALYVEVIGNPSSVVPDFAALKKVAEKHSIPLVVDATFSMVGAVCRPLALGADFLVLSLTKWAGGHGNSIGGAIVDGGKFNFKGNEKFAELYGPSPAYHGLPLADALGDAVFSLKARIELLRDLGSAISPFNAFLIATGLQTLSLRADRINANAAALAAYLNKHKAVESVSHLSLKSHPSHKLAKKQFAEGKFGGVLTFEIKGGAEAGKKFINSVKLLSLLANVGDVHSLVIAPWSTTHQQSDDAQKAAAGVTPGGIRISVGIEHIDDIIADISQALDASQK